MANGDSTNEERGKATQLMIRVTPDLKGRIEDLIRQGKYTTYADFCRTAVYEKLNREEYMARFHDNLMDDFENPETRQRFRKILAEMLAFDNRND